MAAERTPSRRKQCIFRRAFQRFPFGKCERKCRNNSSYDVFPKDAPQQTPEKWSPASPAVSSLGSAHTLAMDSAGERGRTQLPYADPIQDSHLMYDSNGVPPGFPVSNHNAIPVQGPSGPIGELHTDSMQFSHQTLVSQNSAPEYSPVMAPGDEDPVRVALPPSPSISSMETDVEVDPETGERAMD